MANVIIKLKSGSHPLSVKRKWVVNNWLRTAQPGDTAAIIIPKGASRVVKWDASRVQAWAEPYSVRFWARVVDRVLMLRMMEPYKRGKEIREKGLARVNHRKINRKWKRRVDRRKKQPKINLKIAETTRKRYAAMSPQKRAWFRRKVSAGTTAGMLRYWREKKRAGYTPAPRDEQGRFTKRAVPDPV